MKSKFETLIRVQAEWLSDEEKKPVGYLDDKEEKKRKELVQNLECIINYEKNRLTKAYKLKIAEEEDKRQLKLFQELS